MHFSTQREVDLSAKLRLIRTRLDRATGGELTSRPMVFRQYLRVTIPSHRIALTRLLLSDHKLSEERGRWAGRHRAPISPLLRLCRLCRDSIESPEHALLECDALGYLVYTRSVFLAKVYNDTPELASYRGTSTVLLQKLLARRQITNLLAKHAFDTSAVFESFDILRPAQGAA